LQLYQQIDSRTFAYSIGEEVTVIKILCLENFKGFKRLELPEIATITLIGGQNNVGKTSFAKTYTHEVLGAALARGWEVR
jgi:recombinational DNA repair ATPase RecF